MAFTCISTTVFFQVYNFCELRGKYLVIQKVKGIQGCSLCIWLQPLPFFMYEDIPQFILYIPWYSGVTMKILTLIDLNIFSQIEPYDIPKCNSYYLRHNFQYLILVWKVETLSKSHPIDFYENLQYVKNSSPFHCYRHRFLQMVISS